MERYLGRFSPQIYAILRIVAGLMWALHGTQKIFGWPGKGGGGGDLPPLMVAAGWIEIVAGLLVALGLFASFAAFIASGQMAVAYFKAHFPQGFWPTENQGEVAVLYCFLFLFIAATGAGIWSLDALRKKR